MGSITAQAQLLSLARPSSVVSVPRRRLVVASSWEGGGRGGIALNAYTSGKLTQEVPRTHGNGMCDAWSSES